MNNKNQSSQSNIPSVASLAKIATSSNAKARAGRDNNRSRRRDPAQSCDHCKSPNHSVDWCLKKQNDDLKSTIDSLVKKVNAIGKAKIVQEEDSDYSNSMARSATEATAQRVNGTRWNINSACSNTLAMPSTKIADRLPSTLTLRTANNSLIKASTSGTVDLPIWGLNPIRAHVVPNLAEPLLSVSDLTDDNKAVVFLRTRALIVDQPDQLEEWYQDANVIAGVGSRIHRSYYLDDSNQVSFRTAPVLAASYLTWHLRIGHLHLRSLNT